MIHLRGTRQTCDKLCLCLNMLKKNVNIIITTYKVI